MTPQPSTTAPTAPTAHRSPAPIVVGVDNSEASMAALRWATTEAAAHGIPLVALHVHDPRNRQRAPYAQFAARGEDPNTRPADGEEQIEERLTTVVESVFEVGVPSEILVLHAAGARMLVLGHAEQHRRHEGEPFRNEPALGTVARACVARATCPVVVVPIPEQASGPGAAEPAAHRVPEPAGTRAPRVRSRVRATSADRP